MDRKTLRVLVCLMALLAALLVAPAFAQQAAGDDDSLYQALGAKPGLVKLMDDFMLRLLADARMNPFFKDADQAQLKSQLVDQFCELAGGPCKYDGPNMKKAHEGADIDRAAFNGLVEVLQQSMDARGIAFRTQNRLLAKLAPMHRDVINVQ